MENLFVVKTLGAGTIADINELDEMVVGDLVAVGDGHKLIKTGSVAADLTGIDTIKFITKLADGRFRTSAPIHRRPLTVYNEQLYVAGQPKIIRVGGITEALGLVIPSEGEGNIGVQNLSYNHAIATQRVNVSLVKKAWQTPEQYVDAVVAELNASAARVAVDGVPFFVAAKINDAGGPPATYFGITFTFANEHIDPAIQLDGIFEGAAKVTTQEAVVALGKGSDILAMEKDFTRNLGNAGYVQLPDLWYSNPNESSASANYNVATIGWQGVSPHGATSSMTVAQNSLTFAVPTTSTFATITAFLQLIFSTAYIAAGGSVIGDVPDTNAIDNTD